MRTIVIALMLACTALSKPIPASARRAGRTPGAGVPGSQAVSIVPLQVDQGQVVVRLANRGREMLRGELTSGPDSARVTLAPGGRAEVRLPAPMAKLPPNAATQPVPLGFRGTVGAARLAWARTFSVIRPVIPMSEREAPTVEMLFAAAPFFPLGHPAPGRTGAARFQVLHDETGLVFRVEVPGGRAGEGTAVGISVKAWKAGVPSTHAFRYALGPGGPAAARAGGEGGSGAVDARRAGGRDIYDIRIPWSALTPLTGGPGERFRMDVSASAGGRPPLTLAPGPSSTDWLAWTLS